MIGTDKTGTRTVGELTARALCVDGRSYTGLGRRVRADGDVRFDLRAVDASDAAPLLELAAVLRAPSFAFTVLAFAERQRPFGARSEV